MHTHLSMHTHTRTHTVVGRRPWKAGLQLLLRNCSVHHVAVAQFHLFFRHIKSLQSVFFVFSFIFIFPGTIRLLVLSMSFLFPALLKLFKAHLQQGSDPFRQLLCKANLRGSMMHISRMLSRGWRAEFLPEIGWQVKTSSFSAGADLSYVPGCKKQKVVYHSWQFGTVLLGTRPCRGPVWADVLLWFGCRLAVAMQSAGWRLNMETDQRSLMQILGRNI